MLYVRVPKEIKDYEEKIVARLSSRQLKWLGLGCITAIIAFFLLKKFLTDDLASVLVMFIVVPFFGCGFIKIQDMYLDKFISIIFKYYMKKNIVLYKQHSYKEMFDYDMEGEKIDNESKKERKAKLKITKKLTELEDEPF